MAGNNESAGYHIPFKTGKVSFPGLNVDYIENTPIIFQLLSFGTNQAIAHREKGESIKPIYDLLPKILPGHQATLQIHHLRISHINQFLGGNGTHRPHQTVNNYLGNLVHREFVFEMIDFEKFFLFPICGLHIFYPDLLKNEVSDRAIIMH